MKRNEYREITRYKARLYSLGFKRVKSDRKIPSTSFDFIRIIITHVRKYNLEIQKK